jgi:predicted TIM-barrel fold metal-dependent hydrolase
VIHALNQWMHETWSFNYQDRIFATPVITLPILDQAMAELEWVLERGARIVLIRPAPVPGYVTPRSMALPEFDPFWELVTEADIVVGLHSSDSGYQRYVNEWEGLGNNEFQAFAGGSAFSAIVEKGHRPIVDMMASAVGHGLCSRFPTLKLLPVENGSGFVRPLLNEMEIAYQASPQMFQEHPVEVFKRNVYVHPFHEDDTVGLVKLLGADHVIFGSDYPHPEGMSDPITFVDELEGLPGEDIAMIMGGNLDRLMKTFVPA